MPVRILESQALTYDDVLIVPRRSSVYSRKQTSLRTRLVGDLTMELPFLSANMDTVTEARMATAMHGLGALGVIHRFLTPERHLEELARSPGPRILAIGVKDGDLALVEQAADIDAVLVDVAHGHSDRVIERIHELKDRFPSLWIIAGNVATAEGTWDLLEAGAHAIKVGVGPGAVCTTRIVTGCGVPQLTAVMRSKAALDRWWEVERRKSRPRLQHAPTLIADGGIRNSGDIVKALVAGADSVMIGSLFAGTEESPGDVLLRDGLPCKRYRGMASAGAMEVLGVSRTPEGVETWIPWKGPVAPLVTELEGGVRSGLSYCNASSIQDLHDQTIELVRVSHAGQQENQPHATTRAHGATAARAAEADPLS